MKFSLQISEAMECILMLALQPLIDCAVKLRLCACTAKVCSVLSECTECYCQSIFMYCQGVECAVKVYRAAARYASQIVVLVCMCVCVCERESVCDCKLKFPVYMSQ